MGRKGGNGGWYVQSQIHKVHASGTDAVREVSHMVSSSVHALTTPIANAYHETVTTITEPLSGTQRVYHFLVYGLGGWLTYEFVGGLFPREKRALEGSMQRAWKRIRG